MEWSLNSIAKNSRMMRLYFFVVSVTVLFFSLSCNSDPHKGELQFYYYPQKNVYYDPVKKLFFYSLNAAKSWNSFAAVDTAPATLGEKVLIYSKNAEVYRDNESHRKSYGGKLYSVQLSDTSVASTAPESIERKPVQKKKAVATKRSYSRKRADDNSIGKFINKIFGKHR